MTVRTPSTDASIALPTDEQGKLHAPSAARNTADLCAALHAIAPPKGDALEIASGTGQHIVAFAAAMPQLVWQPSDMDPQRLNSIKAYIGESGLSNILAPVTLDATQSGWSDMLHPKSLISLANLLHLISDDEAQILITEAAKTLTAGGKLVLYGPFRRDGQLTSAGDVRFDDNIRSNDPETGYKDDAVIKSIAHSAGLTLVHAKEMPANNLALVFQRG